MDPNFLEVDVNQKCSFLRKIPTSYERVLMVTKRVVSRAQCIDATSEPLRPNFDAYLKLYGLIHYPMIWASQGESVWWRILCHRGLIKLHSL